VRGIGKIVRASVVFAGAVHLEGAIVVELEIFVGAVGFGPGAHDVAAHFLLIDKRRLLGAMAAPGE
jgi:hypothetical protein